MTYIIDAPLLVGAMGEGTRLTQSASARLFPVAAHGRLIFDVRLLHLVEPRVLRLFALLVLVVSLLGCAVSS